MPVDLSLSESFSFRVVTPLDEVLDRQASVVSDDNASPPIQFRPASRGQLASPNGRSQLVLLNARAIECRDRRSGRRVHGHACTGSTY